ncbi:uncharacterized protein TRAVEDRAFT_117289 [Trametes versicolor FP-101664 SS1]|uniref:uncharacterized protein n=1 Tax=Trametes versicolor (strain FP-101664) TaxID=717944 RepID=UPI0004623D5F|nr:uncharacterized protein TRAVEDRAFT_117289 [Trametes versicolor FP-101664 SS1]EIW61152.1 hypothetical protein TRAVEDRAFT_117289 [Trametes versicolor FP-101664 SS1]
MVITSPNMDYVPQYPVESYIVQTFADGRWGVHEYSRWPQMLLPEMMHVACIPRKELADASRKILWEDLRPDVHWTEDPETGVKGLGFLKKETRDALADAAELILATTEAHCRGTEPIRAHCRFIRMILRQVVDRMKQLPSTSGIAVAVGAHVQRLGLELEGILAYLVWFEPRLLGTTNYSHDVLPVLGAFVREGTDAQTCVRIGLPTWFLQPLTHQVRVWKIVTAESVDERVPLSHPPIFQKKQAVAGVLNLTSNWLSTMSLAVSKQVCGTRLMGMVAEGDGAGLTSAGGSPSKRPRIDASDMHSKHLDTSAADEAVTQPEAGVDRPAPIAAHPSRSFAASPFYSVPHVWQRALEGVSPLPQPTLSVVYFYPPPFLLDTVSTLAVHRYLHNLVRIRRFCRTRLFDPSMSSQPLTIAEWRAALWGDYEVHTHRAGGQTEADVRRAQKRQNERNGISRLLGRTALLPSYRPDSTPSLEGSPISAHAAASTLEVRARLLWEAHEVNFRCELMALDTAIVHRPDWTEMLRWGREAAVSGIWGPDTSVVSVIPPAEITQEPFCWSTPPDPSWRDVRRYLARFLEIITRWPDTPKSLVDARVDHDDCTVDYFETVQREAVAYYVRTFVAHFHRLPIPPIRVPASLLNSDE